MMRPARRDSLIIAFLCTLALALVAGAGSTVVAQPDTKAEARTSYEQGKRMYAAGDYKGAIAAFSRAEQLAPSPYNDFNIALCYDKLGDAEIAVKYYRSYLGKVPDASNKAAVEASIARLEAAQKAASSKADDARRAEDARRADEA